MRIILLLLLCSAANAENITVSGPYIGLNDTDASITLTDGEAQALLNVEISQDGQAISKRAGYSLTDSLTIATSPVRGSAYFKDSGGNTIRVFAHDRFVSASKNGATYSNFVTTATVGAKWSFCSSDGKIYGFNDKHDEIWGYDGTTLTYYPLIPKGALCAMSVDRLLVAGTTDYPNRLYFSQSGAVTNFTVGVEPEDPGFEQVNSPGEKITSILATQSEWLAFKRNSMVSYQGSNQYDLTPLIVSERIGMSDPLARVQHEGIVYFKDTENRIWAYNSGTLTELSKKIGTFIGDVSQSSAIAGAIYTDATHFDLGTFVNTTSSRTYGSIEPLLFTYEDTSSDDFNAGTVDVALQVSTGAIYVRSWGPDSTLMPGYFPNIGAEKADNTNWTDRNWENSYYMDLTSPPAESAQYGSRAYRGAGIGSTVRFEILRDDSGAVVEYKEIGMLAAGRLVEYTIDTSGYAAVKHRIRVKCGNTDTYPNNRLDSTGTFYPGSDMKVSLFARGTGSVVYCGVDIDEEYPAASSGTFISQFHTIEAAQPYHGYATATSSNPTGTTTSFYIAFATATTGTLGNWQSTSTVWCSTCSYFKWKAEMATTTNTVSAPYVSDFSLAFQATGYWLSEEKNIGGVVSWGQFLADTTDSCSGSVAYSIAVATYSGGTASATYESITSGSVMSVSTGTHAKLKALFTVTDGTDVLKSNDLRYQWAFATDGMSEAFEYAGDIYFSVPYNYSVSNTRLMKLDQGNMGWTIFDIPVNSPVYADNALRFGSPTSGYLYTYPTGNSDNGANIEAYWQTKDFMGSNPYVEKQFEKISIVAKKDNGSSVNVAYTLDTSSTTTYSVSLSTNTASYLRNNRQLPAGDVGALINVKVSDTSDDSWTFYGMSVDYISDPWRPTDE